MIVLRYYQVTAVPSVPPHTNPWSVTARPGW